MVRMNDYVNPTMNIWLIDGQIINDQDEQLCWWDNKCLINWWSNNKWLGWIVMLIGC